MNQRMHRKEIELAQNALVQLNVELLGDVPDPEDPRVLAASAAVQAVAKLRRAMGWTATPRLRTIRTSVKDLYDTPGPEAAGEPLT